MPDIIQCNLTSAQPSENELYSILNNAIANYLIKRSHGLYSDIIPLPGHILYSVLLPRLCALPDDIEILIGNNRRSRQNL
jgi:hypothetical protein